MGRWVALSFVMLLVAGHASAADSAWVRPEKADGLLVWGRHDGIVFGLPSKPDWGAPRGLIRVGIFPAGTAKPLLLNYIAVEPVVVMPTGQANKGLSELQPSQLDPGQQGKRLWVDTSAGPDAWMGQITTLQREGKTIERLSVPIGVERFNDNHADVRLVASVDSDHPNEVRFTVFAQEDSPPIKELTLTATMGNYERLRLIWLADQVLDSRKLEPDYQGNSFIGDTGRPVSEMLRLPNGDPIVYASSNEADPAAATTAGWPYKLPKLTQYWSVPAADVQPDLRLRVNERYMYWNSEKPVFGGIAFENFELRQKYAPGQTFIFGISPKQPRDLYPGPAKLPALKQ